VRHHEDRHALLVQVGDQVEDGHAGLRVEIARGLVGHDDRDGSVTSARADGDPLLLPARKLHRPVGQSRSPNPTSSKGFDRSVCSAPPWARRW
jgi:hypothetical protein